MSDFEERLERILETAWKRMEDAHINGGRAIAAANQKVLEAFEARPVADASAWYKEQYAKSGMIWPGPDSRSSRMDCDIKDRIDRMR